MTPEDQEEYITQPTAQATSNAQAQAAQNQLGAPATPAPTPAPRPPKAAPPSPFTGAHDDLERFKAECNLYLTMRQAEFQDICSHILFILSYMKGGTARPWATQKINLILCLSESVPSGP